ncbi:hypothetical protein P175DRAFT_0514489 [Aspergillus ochraceoroseus IBT 24754]|uniref:Transcriptional regulatory protein RXT2 N-terminal domain-containing protein n=2 Tax=Aspergillus ochraceoroseus TaxID=138278 RepID=A0A2T5M1I6_9EURO|nr:uncharacterized protein P175DRAFT_0514489 [Aspergillus ochraceoroseus IBT 24754]PTU22402.1 hypothetical protein P175DRAFT_0514489 [Aspergillus ochraceoroseus IBT 24754]
MAAQAALIADTIVGLKRALRNETEYSGPDDPISQPTNRGNKLHANANFVREGALGYVHSEQLYKQKIEHAGYTRYILQHNPVRYDSEGDELDDDDEDSEADAVAAEENPFSEIALEHFLCPLKHPSELPSHPSLSHIYTSKALFNMTKAIETKLRQERALLWRARNLHRKFLGDGSWAPCGMFETPEDRWIFEPKMTSTEKNTALPQFETNGASSSLDGKVSNAKDAMSTASSLRGASSAQNERPQPGRPTEDMEMADGPNHQISEANQSKGPKFEDVDTPVGDLPPHPELKKGGPKVNGNKVDHQADDRDRMSDVDGIVNKDKSGRSNEESAADSEHPGRHSREHDADGDMDMEDGSSPEPPRRMTTRAQTGAGQPAPDQDSGRGSPSLSSETLHSLPTPHPLYLVPDSTRSDANFGLPPTEAEDTRRLLWSYVQKQEETVRGVEHMLENLLRACRMKDDVFEWCKAEGHAGELSDGEDWYDREKWGLAEGEDLKKGADEDDIEPVEEARTTNKRGRGRRN